MDDGATIIAHLLAFSMERFQQQVETEIYQNLIFHGLLVKEYDDIR